MKRLQRNSLALSMLGHGVLLAMLLLGTAFLATPQPPDLETITLLEFVPDKLVDAEGALPGGSPPPVTPPVTPPPLQPKPEPPAVEPKPVPPPKRPDPIPEPVREAVPKPEPVREPEPAKPRYRSSDQIEVNLTKKTRPPDPAIQRAQEEAQRRQAEQQQNARRELANSVNRLQDQFKTQISFSIQGSGGASYMNYGDYVRGLYDRAWREPASGVDSTASVKTEVIIARDGRVVSASIRTPSGNAVLDRSVQETLDRIKNIGRPFPEGSRDQERSFIFNFNLKAKLGLG